MPAPTVAPGQIIGKYRIIRRLGAGGMGAVYEAENPEIGQRVAMKILIVDAQAHPGLFQRFVNEARAANQVKHPAVVKVYDFGQFEDTPWMAMEYLEGESLASRLEKALRLAPHCLGPEALWIVVELASALAAAHERGIVHRDLKPGNIMLVPDPLSPHGERVKLLDFGVAKLHGDDLTKSGAILGTPMYMAPEQFKSAADVDGQADVYALGIIGYQLLCGRLPFQAVGTYELMAAKCFDSPIPLEKYATHLSVEMLGLVMRMLEREPARRPTMVEVDAAGRKLLGLPPPRQSGWHNILAGPPPSLDSAAPLTPTADQPPTPTADVPSKVLEAAQAAIVSTPSEQRVVGEISPPPLAVPDSIGSMPSVPMPAAASGRSVRAADLPEVPVRLIAAALSSPSAPTAREQPRRSPIYALSAILTVGAVLGGAAALWPRHQPGVQTASPAAPTAPVPAVPPAPTQTGHTAPTPTAPIAVAKTEEPAAQAAKVPHPEASPAGSGIVRASAKGGTRGCEPVAPTEACIVTPNLNMRQREIIIAAFRESGAKLCPGDRLIMAGLPGDPRIRVAPPSLRRETQLMFSLGGLLAGRPFPAEVELRCRGR